MKKLSKNEIEYSDTCPVCKGRMKEVDKDNHKHLFYYCSKCKQRYRMETVHPSQVIDCPHCNNKIRLDKKTLSTLHWNTTMNFHTRKVRVD